MNCKGHSGDELCFWSSIRTVIYDDRVTVFLRNCMQCGREQIAVMYENGQPGHGVWQDVGMVPELGESQKRWLKAYQAGMVNDNKGA